MKYIQVTCFLVLMGAVCACGNDPDAATEDTCGFEDRYLPYQAGYQWTYKVVDLGKSEVTIKQQSLTAENDMVYGDVIAQATTKGSGAVTSSVLRRVDDAVVRLEQIERDPMGALKSTTVYDPGQVRLDERSDRLVVGAEWDDVYTASETVAGEPVVDTMRTDHWEVLGVDVDCGSELGDFTCLHLARQRTLGGISSKEFFFAKGIGKIREVNDNQVEEITSCQRGEP